MQSSFWQQLPRPIIGLSPMDGVGDHPFRFIQKKYGQPAIVFTEFTSVEGLCHGADRLLVDFLYDETQRPIIGQIYGTTPDFFRQAAILLCQLGFDGVDINMGCPAKNVAHSGAGAALIQTPQLAQEIIRASKKGVEEWQNGATAAHCPDITPTIAAAVAERASRLPLAYQTPGRVVPISVKTRVGFSQPVIEQWIPTLLETELAAITLHGRTLKQQYSGQANWDLIAQAAEIVHHTPTIILGNGDVHSRTDADAKIKQYGVDGVLIGRATMGNPFVFHETVPADAPSRFQIAIEHARLYEETYKDDPKYFFMPMRKHLGWYIRDIEGASELRQAVFRADSADQVEEILRTAGLL